MDRLIFIAGSGAKQALEKQATTTHNLANASTTGFRAQIDAFRAVPVVGAALPNRAFVVDSTVGADFTAGPIQQTGRDLDTAIQGKGWFAVEMADGSEAYTRNGSFRLSENGVLQTQTGLNIVGDGGPITVPPDVKVSIGKDGTISTTPLTGQAAVNVLGRLKLVNPDEATLERREDGFFRVKGGEPAEAEATVAIAQGALEGSNVNVVESMVSMISAARQFELQMKMIQNAEGNEAKASQVLSQS